MINTVMAAVIVKHLIIPASINNIYKLKEAFKALLEELLYIIIIIVPKRKPNIRTITL